MLRGGFYGSGGAATLHRRPRRLRDARVFVFPPSNASHSIPLDIPHLRPGCSRNSSRPPEFRNVFSEPAATCFRSPQIFLGTGPFLVCFERSMGDENSLSVLVDGCCRVVKPRQPGVKPHRLSLLHCIEVLLSTVRNRKSWGGSQNIRIILFCSTFLEGNSKKRKKKEDDVRESGHPYFVL